MASMEWTVRDVVEEKVEVEKEEEVLEDEVLEGKGTGEGDLTMVELLVTSGHSPTRVRIENRLDGPVWPPRRRGVPASGWDAEGVTCTVAADETRGLGYASPAPAVEPPAEIVRTEPVLPDDGRTDRLANVPAAVDGRDLPEIGNVPDVQPTPDGVVRALGDPRPPRDAVPVDIEGNLSPEPTDDGVVPENVDVWLSDVERRVARAETLAGARALAVAGEELVGVGGVTGARRLVEEVERDEEILRAVARRAEALASRAADADVPLDAYRRLMR